MQASDPASPRRRWFQFRLRTLLVLMAVLAFPLAWVANELRLNAASELAAVESVERLQGRVTRVSVTGENRFTDWLREQVGIASPRPDGVWFSRTIISDGDLKVLASLPKLRILGLGDTLITGDGLQHLRTPELVDLYLYKTKVTSRTLAHVRPLKRLEFLDVSETAVDDAGLEHLHGLTQLRIVRLNDTQVTAAGIARLQTQLPNCLIDR